MEVLTDIEIAVTSPAFTQGASIPAHYTCKGANVHPPLQFDNIPEGADCLVIIMEDPDAPGGTFGHLIAWNINPQTWEIKENEIPGV